MGGADIPELGMQITNRAHWKSSLQPSPGVILARACDKGQSIS
jgi:hypothetical protein